MVAHHIASKELDPPCKDEISGLEDSIGASAWISILQSKGDKIFLGHRDILTWLHCVILELTRRYLSLLCYTA